jgi:phosphoglycolate phosphatase-like HAD superfamily hydrolase
MQLVMFDIDGTLVESNALDNDSYLQALSEVFGFSEISSDWASYSHVTDAGILREVCQRKLGRSPSAAAVEEFQKRFLTLLKESAAVHGLNSIPGAFQMLSGLLESSNYAVAYAGGGWKASALFKIQSVHLPIQNIPYAFSDDDESREGIMAVALARAEKHYRRSFQNIVYIGDGIWDIRAARNLGYGFIGIGAGDRATELFSAGATHVFSNYDDSESFLAALGTAAS